MKERLKNIKMAKQKCWEKTSKSKSAVSYENIETGKIAGVIRVMNNPKGKSWSFNNDGNVSKNFKSKIRALKFANKYMKKHDTC